ncbi:hypothetical protein WJX72_000075 [[Myrmecia] bisecta]|uniref:Uncharacterized protein n=1 Tax=[Myrmecia] bisecta TaxID=41462 RepID=A0AAW1Q7W1_9CHLO
MATEPTTRGGSPNSLRTLAVAPQDLQLPPTVLGGRQMNGFETLHKPVDGLTKAAQEVSWAFTSDGKQGALCVDGELHPWSKEQREPLKTQEVNNINGSRRCMVKIRQKGAASVCVVGYATPPGELDQPAVKHLSASSICCKLWRSPSPTAKGSMKGGTDNDSAIIFCCFLPRKTRHESLRFMACYASGMVAVWRRRRIYNMSGKASPALGAMLLHRLHLNPLGGVQNYRKTGIQFQASYNITGKPDVPGPFVFLHANASLASDPKTSGKQDGRMVATAHENGMVIVWDTQVGTFLKHLQRHMRGAAYLPPAIKCAFLGESRVLVAYADLCVLSFNLEAAGAMLPTDRAYSTCVAGCTWWLEAGSGYQRAISAFCASTSDASAEHILLATFAGAYKNAADGVRRQMKRDLLVPLTQSLSADELLVCQDTNPGGQGDTLLTAAIRAGAWTLVEFLSDRHQGQNNGAQGGWLLLTVRT